VVNAVVVPNQFQQDALDALLQEVETLAARLARAEQIVITIADWLRRMTPSRSASTDG
jgi:hypothetical protein